MAGQRLEIQHLRPARGQKRQNLGLGGPGIAVEQDQPRGHRIVIERRDYQPAMVSTRQPIWLRIDAKEPERWPPGQQ